MVQCWLLSSQLCILLQNFNQGPSSQLCIRAVFQKRQYFLYHVLEATGMLFSLVLGPCDPVLQVCPPVSIFKRRAHA